MKFDKRVQMATVFVPSHLCWGEVGESSQSKKGRIVVKLTHVRCGISNQEVCGARDVEIEMNPP
jgi:hypothetical protein